MNKIFLILLTVLICGCNHTTVLNSESPQNKREGDIMILETGWIDDNEYKVFVDKKTNTRIFWYNHAMVVIPPEKAEKELTK